MRDLDVGSLPVCGDQDRLVGMITDRDIVIRAVADGSDPNTTLVRDAMSPEIVCCFEDDEVAEAVHRMEERQIRRLPVLNHDKRLVGIVSLGDVAVRCRDDRLSGEALHHVSEPPATAHG
jgi:CBS domain-containing protein